MRYIRAPFWACLLIAGTAFGQEGRKVASTPAMVTDRTQVLIRIAEETPDDINGPIRIILELRDEATTSDLLNWNSGSLLNWQPSKSAVADLADDRANKILQAVKASRYGKSLEFIRKQKFWVKGSKEQKLALYFHLSDHAELGDVVSSLATAHPSIEVVDVERKIKPGQTPPSEMDPFEIDPVEPFYRSIDVKTREGEDLVVDLVNSRESKGHVKLVSVTSKRAVVACSKRGLQLLHHELGSRSESVSVSRLTEKNANPFGLQKVQIRSKQDSHPTLLAQKLAVAGFALPISRLQGRLVVLATEDQIERLNNAGYTTEKFQ